MALIDMSETYQMTNPGDHIDGTDVYQSNRNLLDNPWFTVRQRGNGPFTGNGVTGIDRWKTTNANSTVTGNDGYITLTAVSSGNAFVRQYFPEELHGTYTYSAYIRGSGAGYVSVNNSDLSVISSKTFSNPGNDWVLITGTFTTSSNGAECFSIRCNAGTSIDIKCAKLEPGTVSTLPNDAPPDYGTELAKCQRYYYRITGVTFLDLGAALAETATSWLLRFPLPVPMRVAPTTAVSGNFVLWTGSAGAACSGISTHTAVTPPTNPAYVAIKGTSTGMTVGNRYNIQARSQANAYIEFSAEL